jgi:hypothetical protein
MSLRESNQAAAIGAPSSEATWREIRIEGQGVVGVVAGLRPRFFRARIEEPQIGRSR